LPTTRLPDGTHRSAVARCSVTVAKWEWQSNSGGGVDNPGEFNDRDLIVAADGANSAIRARYHDVFQPTLDVRPNYLAWYGTTRLFDPLSLIFRTNQDGLIIALPIATSRTHSTFLVECDPQTFLRAGLGGMSEAESIAYCERAFADDLQGHRLLSNRSNWFRYTIVSNRQWYHGKVVLLGDALRTGHPSVGSGTRLAMQDSIALFDAHRACGNDVPKMPSISCRSAVRVRMRFSRPPFAAPSGTRTWAQSWRSIRSRSLTTISPAAAASRTPTCASAIRSWPRRSRRCIQNI